MPNNYIAPYLISTNRPQNIPAEGIFTVPVCTTYERYTKITNALFAYGAMQGNEFDFDHLIDWLDALPRIVEGCVELAAQCRTIALNDARVEWFPESPYNPEAEVPDGYDFHPWTIANSDSLPAVIIAWGLGYKNGDVFTDLSKFPDVTDPENFTESYLNLPRFRLSVVGTGTVKVDILSIPFGGRLVVIVDEFVDLLNLQAADTDRDASFPPESIVSMTMETEITTEGAHTIDYVFYPTFETELPILGAGGGIRSIEICGFGEESDDMACCDDTNVLLTEIRDLLRSGITAEIRFNGGTLIPDIGGGACAPALFDSDTGETDPEELTQREKALCMTVERYIQAIFLLAITEMSGASTMIDMILGQFPVTSIPTFLKLSVVYPSGFIGLNAFFDALLLPDALKDIACNMVNQLKGQNNTFQNFRDSLLAETSELGRLINTSNGLKLNYTLFNEALEMANDDNLNDYTCPCGIGTDCEEPLDMIFKNDRGVSITNVGGNLYHIIGNHKSGGAGEFDGVYLQDSTNRPFRIAEPTGSEPGLPGGWAGQSVVYYYFIPCDTLTPATGAGGFAPQNVTEIYWDRGDTDNIDTYYLLTCLNSEDC